MKGHEVGTRQVEHLDNPAGRLCAVFRHFRSQNDGISVDEAWSGALVSLNGGNFEGGLVNLFLAELSSLIQECAVQAKSLRSVVNTSDLMISHDEWARAVICFGINRQGPIDPRTFISASSVALLSSLSGHLHTHCPELQWDLVFEKAKLNEIHDQLGKLAERVGDDPEISDSIKSYIVGKLQRVLDTIVLIDLRGPQRLLLDLSDASTCAASVAGDTAAPWHQRIKDVAQNLEAAAKSVLRMVMPVTAVTMLMITGNLQLALFIAAVTPDSNFTLDKLKEILQPKEIER